MFLFLRENNPIKTEITWLHLTQHCKHKELGKSRLVYDRLHHNESVYDIIELRELYVLKYPLPIE